MNDLLERRLRADRVERYAVERTIQWARLGAVVVALVFAIRLQLNDEASGRLWSSVALLALTVAVVEVLLGQASSSGATTAGIVGMAGDTAATVLMLAAVLDDPADPVASITIVLASEAAFRWRLAGGLLGGLGGGLMAATWTVAAHRQRDLATPLDYLSFRILINVLIGGLFGALIGHLRSSHRRAEALLEVSPELIATVDAAGVIRSVNPSAYTLLGVPPERAVGRDYHHYLPGEQAGVELLDELRAVGGGGMMRQRFLHADGHEVMLELSAQHVEDDGLVYVVGRDVTDRVRAERRLSAAEQRYRALFERNLDAVVALDRAGLITESNPSFSLLVGRSTAELMGSGFRELVEPHERDRIDVMVASVLDGDAVDAELLVVRGDDTIRHVDTDLLPIVVDHRVVGVFGLTRDVTELKRREAQLRFEASHDPLTKLGNRAALRDRLTVGLTQDQPIAVLFIDLDDFKQVNDRFGHAAGDAVLVATARRLQDSVRETDLAVRLAGDEFCVVLQPASLGLAEHIASRIEQRIRRPVDVGQARVTVSGSVGIAIVEDGDDPASVLARADAAMYAAKYAARADEQPGSS